jgi:predicted Fe-S protein YdhL (DUF1289 family)
MQPDRKLSAGFGPPSPCINVCTLDPQGFCAGCLRTGAEIGHWPTMSPAQQWQLIAELEKRWKLRAGRTV